MVRSSVKIIPASVVALGTILATPAVGAARGSDTWMTIRLRWSSNAGPTSVP